jgi:hypothetical protein
MRSVVPLPRRLGWCFFRLIGGHEDGLIPRQIVVEIAADEKIERSIPRS